MAADTILELEKSLLKKEFMSDIAYLEKILDDRFTEVGKSGRMFNKQDIISALSTLEKDRMIAIYNYVCSKIGENVYLIHYITKNGEDRIFRTSIWIGKDGQFSILFHQASLYKGNDDLIEC